MKFHVVAKKFDEIEQVSSRTAITELLADLLKSATPGEAALISYLSLGELNPVYLGTQFQVAGKTMASAIAKLLDKTTSAIAATAKTKGDMGLVVVEGEWRRSGEHLTITQVNKALQDIHDIAGTGSVEAKEKAIVALLKALDLVSAKYVVRVIMGKLRLGFSDMTLLDAFSWMAVGDKSLRKVLEQAYNVSVDIGHIVKLLKEEGKGALDNLAIEPGVPIRPAAAERLEDAKAIVKKIGACVAQPKLDGFRLQVHIDNTGKTPKIHFYSRNLQDMSPMFPELKAACKSLKVKEMIFEGEAIAYDIETGTFLPFQETVKRRRKHGIEAAAEAVPLKLYFFDALYLNGESLLEHTHAQRRKILKDVLDTASSDAKKTLLVVEEKKIQTGEQLEEYFTDNISLGLEGLVCKRPDAPYVPGKRNFNWIKLKREETGHIDDTIDCVILGYYAGHGKRANFGIGAFLVGIYNKKDDRFETVAKIGTGLKDAGWIALKKMCDEVAVVNKPRNVECAKALVPDVWTAPEIVCAIRADEITLSPTHSAGATKEHLGYALRFPRIMGYREDKSATDATTVTELAQLFKIQYQPTKKKRTRK